MGGWSWACLIIPMAEQNSILLILPSLSWSTLLLEGHKQQGQIEQETTHRTGPVQVKCEKKKKAK